MMTVCNMLIHGCVGEVICHDSFQPKAFTDGWKVNQALPLTGIPFYKTHEGREYRNPLPEKYRTLQRGSPYHQPIGQIITNLLKNIIMEALATLNNQRQFDFQNNGIEVMDLETLQRTYKENDIYGNPVRVSTTTRSSSA